MGLHTNLFLVSATCIVAGTLSQDAQLVLLTQAAADDGAVCLDGSPAAYYIYRGAETQKWIIQ